VLDGAADPPAAGPAGRTWAAVAVALLLLAAWLLGMGRGAAPAAGDLAGGPAATADPGPPAPSDGAHPPLPAAPPIRLDIPSIGVHAPVIGRGLTDGTIEPPPYDTPGTAGWYRDGPAPGAAGAALIVGHVDTLTGPAVFFPLAGVRTGARVDVTRTDGTVAEFSVRSVETVEKDHFDPARVYGSASGPPELRLITCGGTFDRAEQSYSANVVVRATLTAGRRA
jgi:sortase (surface protein transpeptidase)